MAIKLDRETLEHLRGLPPDRAFRAARSALFASGPVGSEDFLDLYELLVEQQVLSWEEIEALEDAGRE